MKCSIWLVSGFGLAQAQLFNFNPLDPVFSIGFGSQTTTGSAPQCTAGPTTISGRPATIYCKTNSDGGQYLVQQVSSLQNCLNTCAADKKCLSATYNYEENNCYLKNSIQPTEGAYQVTLVVFADGPASSSSYKTTSVITTKPVATTTTTPIIMTTTKPMATTTTKPATTAVTTTTTKATTSSPCTAGPTTIAGRPATVYCKTNSAGGEYSVLPLGSLSACMTACASDKQCVSATFNSQENNCYLKNSIKPTGPADMVTLIVFSDQTSASSTPKTTATTTAAASSVKTSTSSASSQCTPGATTLAGRPATVYCKTNSAGGEYTTQVVSSFSACMSACAADSRCVSVTYLLDSSTCWLKDSVRSPYGDNNCNLLVFGQGTQSISSTTTSPVKSSNSAPQISSNSATAATTATSAGAQCTAGPTVVGGRQATVYCNTNSDGGQYNVIPVNSLSTCMAACASDTNCVSVTYTSDSSTCWLKGGIYSPYPDNSCSLIVFADTSGISSIPGSSSTPVVTTATTAAVTVSSLSTSIAVAGSATSAATTVTTTSSASASAQCTPGPTVIGGRPATVYCKTNSDGGQYSVQPSDSLSACMAACASDTNCVSVTYTSDSSTCWLKGGIYSPFDDDNCSLIVFDDKAGSQSTTTDGNANASSTAMTADGPSSSTTTSISATTMDGSSTSTSDGGTAIPTTSSPASSQCTDGPQQVNGRQGNIACNTNSAGGDYTSVSADSVQGCLTACAADSRCVAAVYRVNSGTCSLKSGLSGSPSPDPDASLITFSDGAGDPLTTTTAGASSTTSDDGVSTTPIATVDGASTSPVSTDDGASTSPISTDDGSFTSPTTANDSTALSTTDNLSSVSTSMSSSPSSITQAPSSSVVKTWLQWSTTTKGKSKGAGTSTVTVTATVYSTTTQTVTTGQARVRPSTTTKTVTSTATRTTTHTVNTCQPTY